MSGHHRTQKRHVSDMLGSKEYVVTSPRKSQRREALDMLASKGLLTHNPSRNQILYSKLGHLPHTRMGAKRKSRRTHKLKRRLKV
jgi:hypothetical protein